MSSLKQLRKALNLSRDEVALFRSALDTAREQGSLETLRIVKGWDERKHPRGQPDNAGQFTSGERAPLFELSDEDEPDHSEIHDKWSDEDSAIESGREQEREARDQKHDKARERDREDAQDRSVEGWRSDDKRIVKERQIEDENREWARVREDEKAFARIRREVTRDRESESTAARRVRDKALATIDREYKQREEEVFKLDNSEETGEDPPAEYYKQLDALEKWHEQRLSKAEKEYEKATEAIDEKYDGEFASRHEEYRDQQDAARRAEDQRISDARQKEDDELEAQRDADLESFGEKYDEETERLRAEVHAKHDADHARRDRDRYHARRESHPDAHAAYYTDDDHKRHRGKLKAFNPAQPRDDAGRWSGSAHKPTHNLTDAQRSTLKQLALLFPDGVHHLLDDSGRVSDAALGVSADQTESALREQIDQHRAAWHAVNDKINDALREVQRTEDIDTADELLNREIEYTLFRSEFDGLRDNEATVGIADALDAAQNSEFPSHPILPWDLHFARDPEQEIPETGHESLAAQADDYARAVDEHKARLEELVARTEGTREQAERESAKFRAEQRQHLERIAGECAKSLEAAGVGESRGRVEDLAARVAGLLTHFPPSEQKAVRKAAAHAPKGGVTIGGKKYAGGEFIPAHVMAEATEEEKENVEGAQEPEEEWDGEIDQDAVNSANTPYSDRNIAQWSNEDGEKHEIWVEEGRYTPPGEDEMTVYRFISFDSNDDREQEGEWVAERDDAIREGKQYARNNHEETRDPEDSDIEDVNGQDWGNRETIGNYTTEDGSERTVRLEEGTFDFGGTEHECYRWTTRRDEDGEWTLDRRQAVRDGEAYAEENHHEPEEGGEDEDDSPDYSDVSGGAPVDLKELPPPTKREVTLGEEKQAKSAAKFEMGNVDTEQADHLISTIFGAKSAEAGRAALVASLGMPDDATVRVTYAGDYQKLFSDDMPADGAQGVRISVDHPKMGRVFRFVGVDHEGKRFIRNEIIEIKAAHQGEGLGAEIFSKQVEAAAESGIDYIATHAAGSSGGSMNGYYTWPRFGYNQGLDDSTALGRKVLAKFPDAQSVLDVMTTQEGRDWWKENGSDLYKARFDLTPGSRSLAILSAYQQERAKKKGTKKSTFRPTTKRPLMPRGSGSKSKTKSN
ncbi:hypothetical protein VT84_13970 [Gemmata sp. SH-PL17]|uniref:hypothetical protein n=1 Tax=Gemmata sp. SH-PL17 TaxID=1630693 RepID=UPI00078DB90D|nr:hypothetical protein [Gemmata sp. SH-PL17]AMV25501.1 hypothetical protein VT84_13970 [Gemmata sp. SH-PL17]